MKKKIGKKEKKKKYYSEKSVKHFKKRPRDVKREREKGGKREIGRKESE